MIAVETTGVARWSGMDEDEYTVGPSMTVALIVGFMAFYGLLIAVALARA